MSKRNGLALLASLMVMAGLVALAFSLASLVLLELRQQEAVRRERAVRMASENAALVGLAELQAGLGPDVGHSFESSPGHLVTAGKSAQMKLTGEFADGSILCRWSVTDLSMGYDMAARSVASGQASAWARTGAGRAKLPFALAESVSPSQSIALAGGGPEFSVRRQTQLTPGRYEVCSPIRSTVAGRRISPTTRCWLRNSESR